MGKFHFDNPCLGLGNLWFVELCSTLTKVGKFQCDNTSLCLGNLWFVELCSTVTKVGKFHSDNTSLCLDNLWFVELCSTLTEVVKLHSDNTSLGLGSSCLFIFPSFRPVSLTLGQQEMKCPVTRSGPLMCLYCNICTKLQVI